jgi:hypothetical protein
MLLQKKLLEPQSTTKYRSLPQKLVTKSVRALLTLFFVLMLITFPFTKSFAQCTGPNNCPPGGCNAGQQIFVENTTDCEMDLNSTTPYCSQKYTVYIPKHSPKLCFGYPCIQCDNGCYCANSIDLFWSASLTTISSTPNLVGVYDFPDSNISPLRYCTDCPPSLTSGIRIIITRPNPGELDYTISCLP